MTEAHIASILPIKNRVLAADENTTFLGHYDLNEHDVFRGVKAIGDEAALDFNGSSSYVQYPNAGHLDLTTHGTIEAWIKIREYGNWKGILTKGVNSANYGLQLDNATGKKLQFCTYPYAGGNMVLGVAELPLGEWVHVAAVYAAGAVTLYINGAVDATGGITYTSLPVNTEPLTIGADLPGGDEFFTGQIRSAKVWRRALSGVEVRSSMNGMDLESGLVAHYPLDEGEGSISRDRSAFHNDGVILNPSWVIGNSIFTLRKQEGKFGGAIALEEATENLIPGGTKNTYPSYGSQYGSYGTHLYNGGAFFSIGTIASVTNNIVTLSTTPVTLNTYDVLRPQTSGGGVIANQNYFVKKHSATSFSLHAYDSTNDGSKGFEVHKSIASDTRIEINATGLTDMWQSPPHSANMGMVKEIIPNGFDFDGRVHDCMRWHNDFRSDTVSYGMAYNVNPPVTQGRTYVFSCYLRAVDEKSIGKRVSWTMYTSGGWPQSGNFEVTSMEWKRHWFTSVAPATGGTSLYFTPWANSKIDISEIQCEDRNFPTSFVTGSRLKSTVSYPPEVINPNAFTVNAWVKLNGHKVGVAQPIFELSNKAGDVRMMLSCQSTTKKLGLWQSGVPDLLTELVPTPDEWWMVTLVYDGNTRTIYHNGQPLKSDTRTAFAPAANSLFYLGGGVNGTLNGLIDELRIDKVARTDEEIMAWYQSNSPFWPRGIYRKSY